VTALPLQPGELSLIARKNGFRVQDVARRSGMGVRTLERRFKEDFHASPKAWMIGERLRLARLLLAEGQSNKEVAASLGYAYESNFCRAFKGYFGCPPQKLAHKLHDGSGGFRTR
jgi:AraC-like DNA-binding protein